MILASIPPENLTALVIACIYPTIIPPSILCHLQCSEVLINNPQHWCLYHGVPHDKRQPKPLRGSGGKAPEAVSFQQNIDF